MAKIVGAFGCSHGPLLTTPPDMWHLREGVDRRNPAHKFRGGTYDFPSLLAERGANFDHLITAAEKKRRYDACQRGVEEVARRFKACNPDLAIILGNDQRELFRDDFTPAFLVYAGAQIENVPSPPEEHEKLAAMGLLISEKGHCPPEGAVYPGAPEVARTIVTEMIDREFDVAISEKLPKPEGRDFGIPHAFGFMYVRIMNGNPPPSVPIFLNVGEGPNQPRLQRLLRFGHALREIVDGLPGDARVAIIASGGFTHFVIDEEFDQQVLTAMQAGDEKALAAFPEPWFWGNTCETKSWYPLVAAMNDEGKKFDVIDYVPCYRSVAGTGQAMIFASWN
jgi:hypothetical protein